MGIRTEDILSAAGMGFHNEEGVGFSIVQCGLCPDWHMHIRNSEGKVTPVANFANEEAARATMLCMDIMSRGQGMVISPEARKKYLDESRRKPN